LDHTDWLGKDEYAIAEQKAGIIKRHGLVISGVSGPGEHVIVAQARAKKATLWQLHRDFDAKALSISERLGKQSITFKFGSELPEIIEFGLLGFHQIQNASLVMAAVRQLKILGWVIPDEARNYGLRHVEWPGRFQIIRRPQSA